MLNQDSIINAIPSSRSCLPTVSVVVPAYNAAAYIGDALSSVLAQTRLPEEIVVVDDGSKDGTVAAVEEPTKKAAAGHLIHLVRQPNAGVMAARNRGIAEAKGEWIALLDADDIWFPDKLAHQVRHLDSAPADVLLCCAAVAFRVNPPAATTKTRVDEARKISAAALLQRNWVVTSSVLVSKVALSRIGGFSPRYNHAEDWAVWLRLAATGTTICFTPTPLIGYRLTPGALGTRNPAYLRAVECQIIEEFVREYSELGIARQEVREALAGACYRNAISFTENCSHYRALEELFRSGRIWPRRLPEYAARRLPRLRLAISACRGMLGRS